MKVFFLQISLKLTKTCVIQYTYDSDQVCFEYKYDEKDAGDRDHFRNRKTIFENFKPFSKYFPLSFEQDKFCREAL